MENNTPTCGGITSRKHVIGPTTVLFKKVNPSSWLLCRCMALAQIDLVVLALLSFINVTRVIYTVHLT